MPLSASGVGGIVLCGGQSRRMGRPKAWLPCGREVLLQRIVRLVSSVVTPVVVAARRGQSLPPLPPDIDVVYDLVEDAGPLSGMAAGLEALASRCQAALVTSCDHPLLEPDFLRTLIDLLRDAPAVVLEHEGRVNPLLAVYRVDTRDLLLEMLARGDLRATDFAELCGARHVSSAKLTDVDPDLDSLKNVNDASTFARTAPCISG